MNRIKNFWRRLDNTAKIFSLEEKSNNNTFRLSVILKELIDYKTLKIAINNTLNFYPEFKVKLKKGLFWNYLERNSNEPNIEREKDIPCKRINTIKNKGYLFKVTYYKHKINLDIFHVLTDGVGATEFFKKIIENYLNIKYKLLKEDCKTKNLEKYKDQYIINADKKIIPKIKNKKAFLIKEKAFKLKNKTYHYILNLEKFKNICKKLNVTITEYLTAIYIEALYKSVYDKNSKKDLIITIPIDLRKQYNVKTLSNFFTCMNIESNVKNKKSISFNTILKQVHNEFKNKLTTNKIKEYLSKDVKLGTNIFIRLIPLSIKKIFFNNFGKLVNQSNTTTLSNIGKINFEEKYKKYIDNIMVLVSAGKYQKVKCTVCSYNNNLTVTLNSRLISTKLEDEFYKLLKERIGTFKLESNIL